MSRLVRITPLLTLLGFAAACSNDGSGPEQEELTTQEAEALASALFSLTLGTGFSAAKGGGPAASPAQVPITFSQTASFTGACPLGGSVSVSADVDGTVDVATGALDVAMDITETHESCVVQH